MNTIKCPDCGSDNILTNIRCEKCGRKLITTEEVNNINHKSTILDDPDKISTIKSTLKIFKGIKNTIVGLILIIILLLIILNNKNVTIFRILSLPILVCVIAMFIYCISITLRAVINLNKGNINKLEKHDKKITKIGNTATNIIKIGFFIFWFSFLIVVDLKAIEAWNTGGNQVFLFTLIFWIVGIFILIREIILIFSKK